jgi:hypothetical protein
MVRNTIGDAEELITLVEPWEGILQAVVRQEE